MTTERDIRNQIAYARDEGKKEGKVEGREEGRVAGREEERFVMAKKFKALGVPVGTIAEATGLPIEQIEAL